MRVALLHNPSAGDETSFEEVHRALSSEGYALASEIEKDSDFERVRDEAVEFVVVAGGDGTVRQAARALAGSRVPLAILPLGTANNIAKSLGIEGEVREVVAGWKRARTVPFDLGVARGQWGESRFLESVGSGLVTAGIAAAEEHPEHGTEDTRSELARAIERYAEALARAATASMDGASGRRGDRRRVPARRDPQRAVGGREPALLRPTRIPRTGGSTSSRRGKASGAASPNTWRRGAGAASRPWIFRLGAPAARKSPAGNGCTSTTSSAGSRRPGR